MSALHLLLLVGLGIFSLGDGVPPSSGPFVDPAQLREMLEDQQHPRMQSQAALLLVQSREKDAEEIVRKGLKQTDSAEEFIALSGALRLCHDVRFGDELQAALQGGRLAVRQAAAETLAVLADDGALIRLQALVEDAGADPPARQLALWTLGRSGRKGAVVVLLEQLSSRDDTIRRAAADALTDLTGLNYGSDTARWRSWWQGHKDLPNDRWLEERLVYQASRARRLEGELGRVKTELVQLHQQLYQRLPAADRLGHVQTLAESDDPAVRAQVVAWSAELLPLVDSVGQRALADLLLHLTHDGNVGVQRPAVLALGRVQDARAFDLLKRLLRHGPAPVRAAAAYALTQQALPKGSPSDLPSDLHDSDRINQVVPLLQKALEDPALDVVVAVAENLGSLGVPEAGPVLTVLLRHPSESVRQTAAQALERVADPNVLDGLLAGLEDPAVTVRFGLVGALGRLATDGSALSELQRTRMLARLEELLLRDADPGVRSRAATVLGQCGGAAELSFLWRRVQSREDSRVQDKAWAAMLEILTRSASLDQLRQWDRTLVEADQSARRVQMLTEINDRWKKNESTRSLTLPVTESLVQALLEQGKWATAFPLVRELLDRPGNDTDLDRRLRWLLTIGEKALAEGNRTEAHRAVREAQPFLSRSQTLAVVAADFEKLEKRVKQR